jgi:hypothetical protein
MLNYPCCVLAGWLDQVLVVVAMVPTIHHHRPITLTLGSRNYFSRRALILEDHLLRQKFREINFDGFPDSLMRIACAIYYHRYIPMDIGIHLSFSRSFLVALVVTRCLEIFFVVRKIL